MRCSSQFIGAHNDLFFRDRIKAWFRILVAETLMVDRLLDNTDIRYGWGDRLEDKSFTWTLQWIDKRGAPQP